MVSKSMKKRLEVQGACEVCLKKRAFCVCPPADEAFPKWRKQIGFADLPADWEPLDFRTFAPRPHDTRKVARKQAK
jgi:hypothetical protein